MTGGQTEVEVLKKELEENQKKIMELTAALEESQTKFDDLQEEYAEIDEIVRLSDDEKLSLYLKALVDKLKERHDVAAMLRLDEKISEYTFTNLTFGLQLAYMAKEAYALVVKEAGGLLEPVEASKEESMEPTEETAETPLEIVPDSVDEN